MQPPILALDNERIMAAARSAAGLQEIPSRPGGRKVLMYYLFLNEVGEIVSVRMLGGPRLAEVEAELLRTRVVVPGRRGQDAVPVAVVVEVSLD